MNRLGKSANVLLDLDGTLTDPREGFVASVAHALKSLDHPIPPAAQIASYIGPPLDGTMRTLLGPGREAHVPDAIAFYRQRYANQGIFENAAYPGVPEALDALHRLGTSLYLATSKPHVFAERILEYFGLRRFFKAVYGSELDGTRSEKGELIAYIVAQEQLDPQLSVMVGDRAYDVRGAKLNGMRSVGALWGYGSRAELADAGATMFCERPIQLPGVLSSN